MKDAEQISRESHFRIIRVIKVLSKLDAASEVYVSEVKGRPKVASMYQC